MYYIVLYNLIIMSYEWNERERVSKDKMNKSAKIENKREREESKVRLVCNFSLSKHSHKKKVNS